MFLHLNSVHICTQCLANHKGGISVIYHSCSLFDLRCESVTLICYNTAVRGLTDIYIYICTTPEGAQRQRESANISVKPRARPCYNIYVTPPNLPCLMCSACDDIVSKSLIAKRKVRKTPIISAVCNFRVGVLKLL